MREPCNLPDGALAAKRRTSSVSTLWRDTDGDAPQHH